MTTVAGFDISHVDTEPKQVVVPGKIWVTHLRQSSDISAAIYWFGPGAEAGEDRHDKTEIGYVINGELSDENGTYTKGTFFIAQAGTVHHPRSENGAIVLIVHVDQEK
ncbi:cupin domain-containing protein [Streptomyces sp. 7N604]|uniref:cupin domain-containing protein n=1 Tax=Streptomyces sp. 7N604 TaxID=3457415 RepID=UPI003FD55188